MAQELLYFDDFFFMNEASDMQLRLKVELRFSSCSKTLILRFLKLYLYLNFWLAQIKKAIKQIVFIN